MADFFKLMTPVLAANALTVAYVYGLWRLIKWERERGLNGYRVRDLLLIILPNLALIYGLYVWGFAEVTPLRHLLASPAVQQQSQKAQ